MTKTETPEQLKQLVKEKYGQIAEQSKRENETSCCGAICGCSTSDEAIMADDYSELQGYVAAADLGLGCGLPTEFALIHEGDTVVDLGSGAGNDAFIARSIVGEKGRVIGIDLTEKMVEKAKVNAAKLNYTNVEFRLGDIEDLPLADNTADVVVSNCVLNLVPDKKKAFAETFRVLRKGGHFSVSDIVLVGDLPEDVQKSAELYVGCVAGALQKEDYLNIIKEAGFSNIRIQKEKQINLPDDLLMKTISDSATNQMKEEASGIFSITVYAEKPEGCCGPGCCN